MNPEQIDEMRRKEEEKDAADRALDEIYARIAVPPKGFEVMTPLERFNNLWSQIDALLLEPLHETEKHKLEGHTPSRVVETNDGIQYELCFDLEYNAQDDIRYVNARWQHDFARDEGKDPYTYLEGASMSADPDDLNERGLSDLANVELALIAFQSASQ